MKKYIQVSTLRNSLLAALLAVVSITGAIAQTPGEIVVKASPGASTVLDPNGDDFISANGGVFSTNRDEGPGISEIPYRPFPALAAEPTGDVRSGNAGGQLDFVSPATPLASPNTGSPVAVYFDGVNVMFRMRVGDISPASRGYSVLIESNDVFSGTLPNPGFEFEVLYATNGSVQVIDHRQTISNTIFSGSMDQYAQRSVAASTNGGNPDYFYDFYVPMSAFGGAITNTSLLRMVGSTVTTPQTALVGTVSDVGGVNFQAYGNEKVDAWNALIGLFPRTTLNQINSGNIVVISATPAVNSPIVAGSTSISGTSTEIVGSAVSVLRNGASICGGPGQPVCPTVSANGTWTLSGLANNLLVASDNITARVTAPGKTISQISSAVTVTAGICATPAPRITGTTTGNTRQIVFEPSFTGSQLISIYTLTGSTPVFTATINPTNLQELTLNFNTASSTTYYITTTPLSSSSTLSACESPRSNLFCRGSGQSVSTIITHDVEITEVTFDGASTSVSGVMQQVPANLATITATIDFGGQSTAGRVYLYVNGERTDVFAEFLANTQPAPLDLSTLTTPLEVGDILTLRTVVTGNNCTVTSTISNPLIVSPTTPAPIIDVPACGPVTSLTGTSTAPIGSTIQFYTGGTEGTRTGTLITQEGGAPVTAVVTSTGVWVADFTSTTEGNLPAGAVITARATVTGNLQSVNSAPVTVTPGTEGVLTVNPITAGQTIITGTAPESANGGIITIYIDDTEYETEVFITDTTWGIEGLASTELYAGASVTATFTPAVPNACESERSVPVIVSCVDPDASFTLSTETNTVCSGGTVTYTLSGSEFGILYTLIINDEESGNSVIGTGSTITLTSGAVTNETDQIATQTVTYRARSLEGVPCDAFGEDELTIQVQPAVETEGLVFVTPDPVCANETANILVTGTNPAYTYQLVNAAGIPVGTAVPGNATEVITLTTDEPTTNTSYGLLISSGTGADACSTTLPDVVDVFVIGPTTNGSVTALSNKVCTGGFTGITIQTQGIEAFEYTVYRTATPENGLTEDAIVESFTTDDLNYTVETPILSSVGTETFYVTVQNTNDNTCGELRLANTVTIDVTNSAINADAGEDMIVSGNTVQLQGNDLSPDRGVWSQVSGPNQLSITPVSSPTATASGLVSGEVYILRWTSFSSCDETQTTFDEVTITRNSPATYTVYAPRYNNEYANGEILALAEDPDGPISGATRVSGTIPDGLTLEDNGNIVVSNRTLLGEGVFPLTIELPQGGQSTVLSIVIRLLGDEPVIIPLPVELVYFTATVRNNQAHLEWLTASELDNDRFEIERSLDARSFEKIGEVKGKGTTSLETKYRYTDRTPVQGTVYYRLKQVDIDGQFAYSNVIAVNAKGLARELATQAYPNPFHDVIKVALTVPEAQVAAMTIYDINGRRVMTKDLELDAGVNNLELQLDQLQSGMYILKVVGEGMESTTRLMKN